jgi:hypothetical protein
VVQQFLLGGNTIGALTEQPIVLHAGLPTSSGEDVKRWVTPQQCGQLTQDCLQVFRSDHGVEVSTCMIANYHGTQVNAVTAVMRAADRALLVFKSIANVSSSFSPCVLERFHYHNLGEFIKMHDEGRINSLSFYPKDY